MTVTTSRRQSLEMPSSESPIRRWQRFSVGSLRGLPAVVLVGAVTAVPVVLLLINSFNVSRPGEPSRYGLDNWRRALSDSQLGEAIWNTVRLGLTRTVVAVVIATVLSLLIARTDMPGRRVVEVALWFAFFIPALSMTLGWIVLLDSSNGVVNTTLRSLLGLSGAQGPLNIYSFWGIILAHISASTVPIMTILIIPSLRRMSSGLEEAARSCGAGRFKTIVFVTLPLARPAILSAALLSFIQSLKAFEIEYLLGNPVGFKVYSTQIYDWIYREPPLYGMATALGMLIIPVMVFLAVGQRMLVRDRNFETVGSRGFSDAPMALGRIRRWVVAGIVYLYVLLVIGLPVGALIVGSFMRRFGFFHVRHPFTTSNWSDLIHDDLFASSVINSLKIGIGATLLGVAMYFAIAYIIVRSRMRGRATVDVLAWLPVALPGILLGLGLLWFYLGTPLRTVLYGSVTGLILAIVINHMATGTQQMKAGIMQISPEHDQAARTCGAPPLRSLWHIMLPLIAPSVAAVAVLTFDSAIRDISSVILLTSGKSRPLSVLLLEYSSTSELEEAAALGVIMSAVTVLFGLVATKLAGGRLQRRARRAPERTRTGSTGSSDDVARPHRQLLVRKTQILRLNTATRHTHRP
jgi:iron(III) transport system permease protein